MTTPQRIPGRRFLHSPGPTPLPEAVLHAMSAQPMDLADPRVDANIAACEQGLRRLLQARACDIFMYASNGHGVWEAVVENLVAPGEAVLVPGTGHFSESWAVQTEALGRRVVRTPWREGWAIDAAAVEQALREDKAHAIKAVFAVHTDTASGVTSEPAAMRRAIDAAGHPALLVADVVASLGAIPFAMDALGVDVAVGASQKGLMCPPGVGFTAVNAGAFAAAQASSWPAPCMSPSRAGARAARWISLPRIRPAARTRSPPSRWPKASTSRRCAPRRVNASRWPWPAGWGR